MQPWRAIHLLAPDGRKAAVCFKSSFSLGRNLLRGMRMKNPSEQPGCFLAVSPLPWERWVRAWGCWGDAGEARRGLPGSASPAALQPCPQRVPPARAWARDRGAPAPGAATHPTPRPRRDRGCHGPAKRISCNNSSRKTQIIPGAPLVRKNHSLAWNQRHSFLHLEIKVSRCLPLQPLPERTRESTKESDFKPRH